MNRHLVLGCTTSVGYVFENSGNMRATKNLGDIGIRERFTKVIFHEIHVKSNQALCKRIKCEFVQVEVHVNAKSHYFEQSVGVLSKSIYSYLNIFCCDCSPSVMCVIILVVMMFEFRVLSLASFARHLIESERSVCAIADGIRRRETITPNIPIQLPWTAVT